MTSEIIKSKALALKLMAEVWRNEEGSVDVRDEYTVVYFESGPCILYNMASGAISVVTNTDDGGLAISGQGVGEAASMVIALVCSAESQFQQWVNTDTIKDTI